MNICRICLATNADNSVELSTAIKEYVDSIIPPLNSNLKMLCETCAESFLTTYQFINTVNKTENKILREKQSLNVDIVHAQNKSDTNEENFCRTCLKLISNPKIFLNQNILNIVHHNIVQKMLEGCDLYLKYELTNKPVMCIDCWVALQAVYTFKKDYLDIRKKVIEFCKLQNYPLHNVTEGVLRIMKEFLNEDFDIPDLSKLNEKCFTKSDDLLLLYLYYKISNMGVEIPNGYLHVIQEMWSEHRVDIPPPPKALIICRLKMLLYTDLLTFEEKERVKADVRLKLSHGTNSDRSVQEVQSEDLDNGQFIDIDTVQKSDMIDLYRGVIKNRKENSEHTYRRLTFRCDKCNFGTSTTTRLKKHIAKKHEVDNASRPPIHSYDMEQTSYSDTEDQLLDEWDMDRRSSETYRSPSKMDLPSSDIELSLHEKDGFIFLANGHSSESDEPLSEQNAFLSETSASELDVHSTEVNEPLPEVVGSLSTSNKSLSEADVPLSEAERTLFEMDGRLSKVEAPLSEADGPLSEANEHSYAADWSLFESKEKISLCEAEVPLSEANGHLFGANGSLSQEPEPLSEADDLLSKVNGQLSEADEPLLRSDVPLSKVQQPLPTKNGSLFGLDRSFVDVDGRLPGASAPFFQVNRPLSEAEGSISDTDGPVSETDGHLSEVKVELSEVKVESSEVKEEFSEVKVESSEVKEELSEVKVESSEVKVESSEMNVAIFEVNEPVTPLPRVNRPVMKHSMSPTVSVLQPSSPMVGRSLFTAYGVEQPLSMSSTPTMDEYGRNGDSALNQAGLSKSKRKQSYECEESFSYDDLKPEGKDNLTRVLCRDSSAIPLVTHCTQHELANEEQLSTEMDLPLSETDGMSEALPSSSMLEQSLATTEKAERSLLMTNISKINEKPVCKRVCCEEASKDHTITSTHEILLENAILMKHDKSIGNLSIKKYSCDQCHCKTKYKDCFHNHVLAKHDKMAIKKYSCDQCDYHTHYKKDLNKHVLAKHDKMAIKKYRCDQCDFKTHYKKVLNDHVLARHNKMAIKKYRCDQCDYQTHYKNALNGHVLAKHDKMAIKKYRCNQCDYQTHIKTLLNKHVLAKHDKMAIKKYSCDQCDYHTHNKSYLNYHVLAKHDKMTIKKYGCDQCDFKTHYKKALNVHVLARHNKMAIKKYRCNQCDYQTHYKRDLNNHVLAKHDKMAIKKYSCDQCDYQTHVKSSLNSHVLAKHDKMAIKNYRCDQCDYQTHYKKDLNRHVLAKHDKMAIKKYSCYYCDYRSHISGYLQKHMRYQHVKTIKPYGCDQCDYKALHKSDLNSHMSRKHNNFLKMYICYNCNFKTQYKKELKGHVVAKHFEKSSIKLYGCDQCDYKAHYKSALNNHVLVKHDKIATKNATAIIVD